MAKCWLCPKEFPNKTALNSHVVSKEHRRQTVVCVFCNTEKTFMKPGDLERHCRTSHFDECKNLSRSFFSTGNCMYFAVFPEDYIRTISKAEPWGSGDAIQARGLMKSHLVNQLGGSVKLELMLQGWRKALKSRSSEDSTCTPQKETGCDQTDKSETNRNNESEQSIETTDKNEKENTEKQYESKGEKNVQRNENKKLSQEESKREERQTKDTVDENKDKVHQSQSVNQTGSKDVFVKDKVHKTEKENKTNVERKSDDKVEIKDKTVKSDEGHKDSQKKKHKHKSKRQKTDEDTDIKVKKQKIENKENAKTDANANSEVKSVQNDKSIKECSVSLSDCDSGAQTPLQDERQTSLPGELPILSQILKTKLNQENVKPKKVSFNEYLIKKKESQKTEIRDTHKQLNLVRDEHNIWRRQHMPVSESNTTQLTATMGNEKPNLVESEKNYEFDMYAGVPNRYELSREVYETELFYDPEGKVEITEASTESKLVGESDNSTEEKRSGEETPYTVEAAVRESGKEMEIGLDKDNNNNNVTEKQRQNTEKHRLNTDEKEENVVVHKPLTVLSPNDTKLRELACDILATGVMPLCPPGRRDWGEVMQYHLAEFNFKWPPTNWSTMSPDRRLLAWEFAAMSLEQLTEGSVDPSLSRAYLLDKYNFLALPGTPKHVKDREEVAASRSRFYTYQMVREVASGKRVTAAVEAQLRCLEGVRKVSDDFKLRLRTIDAPLRLKHE